MDNNALDYNLAISLWLLSGLLLFSAPKTSSASVISEIAQFSSLTFSNFLANQIFHEKSEYKYLYQADM